MLKIKFPAASFVHLPALLIATALLYSPAQAQDAESATLTKYATVATGTELRVTGSSTLHDWTVTTDQIIGHLAVDTTAGIGKGLQAINVMVPASSLKSDHKKMNNKMYEALDIDRYPSVSYSLTSAKKTGTDGDGVILLETTGTLSLHGTETVITMPIRVETLSDTKLKLTGAHTIQLPDYGMKPPKAMLGAIRVGPEVTVSFDWVTEAE